MKVELTNIPADRGVFISDSNRQGTVGECRDDADCDPGSRDCYCGPDDCAVV